MVVKIQGIMPQKHNYQQSNKFVDRNEISLQSDKQFTRNSLVDLNNNKAFIHHAKNIAFTGVLLPESDISNTLNAVWSKLKPNEVAVITNDFDKTIKTVKTQGLPYIKFLMKNLVVIKNDNFENNLIAYKNREGVKKIVLLGEGKGTIHDSSNGNTQFTSLLPGEPQNVFEGNKIYVNKERFVVHDNVTDPEYYAATKGIEILPMTSWDTHCIEELNKRHISEIKTLFNHPEDRIMFKDVIGQDEAVMAFKKAFVYPLKYPEAFKDVHNRGIVCYGPPGTGKTMLAKAACNEVHANYYEIDAGAQKGMYVGETEENWRKVFDEAIEHQPSVVFIDEADSSMSERGGSEVSKYNNSETNQILSKVNEIMYGGYNVFVILATNKIELLDKAILRSGRFGEHIPFNYPNVEASQKLLQKYSKGFKIDKKVDFEALAKRTNEKHCVGSDFPCIVEAARNNAYQRLHILEKMDNGTFDYGKDMKNFSINPEDFDKALASVKREDKVIDKRAMKPNPVVGFHNNYTGANP